LQLINHDVSQLVESFLSEISERISFF